MKIRNESKFVCIPSDILLVFLSRVKMNEVELLLKAAGHTYKNLAAKIFRKS